MRLQQLVQEVAPTAQLRIATSGAIDARRSAVKVDDVERTLKRKVDCQIPADSGAALAAVNFGKPISEAAPNSAIVKALRPLVAGLDQPGAVERGARQGHAACWPASGKACRRNRARCSACAATRSPRRPRRRQRPGRSIASGARSSIETPRRRAGRCRSARKRGSPRSRPPCRTPWRPACARWSKAGAPAGEVTRQAGQLAQLHFRSNGVLLAPLELARLRGRRAAAGAAGDQLRRAGDAGRRARAWPRSRPWRRLRRCRHPTCRNACRRPRLRRCCAPPAAAISGGGQARGGAPRGGQAGQQAVAQQGRPGAARRAAPGDEPHRPRGRRQPAAQGTGAPARGPGRRAAGRAPPPAQPAGAGRISSTRSSTT